MSIFKQGFTQKNKIKKILQPFKKNVSIWQRAHKHLPHMA